MFNFGLTIVLLGVSVFVANTLGLQWYEVVAIGLVVTWLGAHLPSRKKTVVYRDLPQPISFKDRYTSAPVESRKRGW